MEGKIRESGYLQAPFIKIKATVTMPGTTNGIPNIKEEDCINCANLLKEKFVKKTILDLMDNVENMVQQHSESLIAYKEIFESVIGLLKELSAPVQNGKTKL